MKKITLIALVLISAIMNGQTKLGISTDRSITFTQAVNFVSNNQFPKTDITTGVFEGANALKFSPDASAADNSWAMASIQPTAAVDISSYNTYSITVKSTSNGDILFRLQSSGQKAILTFTALGAEYGFVRDGNWHTLNIPMSAFKAANASIDLAAISDLLVLRSQGDITTYNNYDFYIDDFYLTTANLGTGDFNVNKVSIYPNPTSKEFKITSIENIDKVTFFNSLGQIVQELSPNKTDVNIDISSYTNGLYLIQIDSNGKSITQKLIKN